MRSWRTSWDTPALAIAELNEHGEGDEGLAHFSGWKAGGKRFNDAFVTEVLFIFFASAQIGCVFPGLATAARSQ